MITALTLATVLALSAPSHASPALQDFVGSTRCASCHKRQHQLWSEDWHARALSAGKSRFVVGRFDPPAVFNQGGTHAEAFRSGEAFRMKAQASDGSIASFPINWVIGGRRMQDFVTRFPDGRLQILPIYFHVTGKGEWVDYTTIKQGPLTKEHPFFWANYARTFNKECLSCHVTGEDIGWNEKAGEFHTTWSEPGIACEKCHGAGRRHAKDGLSGSIVRPTSLSRERGLALCASCHSPRAPWRSAFAATSRFRPGQRFEEVFEPVTPILGPDDLSGDFWLDGRPSVGSMESAALEQSACVRQGGMTCFTCHTAPHGRGDLSELRPQVERDRACSTCHPALNNELAAAKHSFHKAGPGSACADCHMPRMVVGVLDPQIDHSIDIPNPQNSRDFGIPNACTACHKGKSPEWAIRELAKRFPGSSRGIRRQRLAHALASWRDHASSAESEMAAVLSDREEIPLMRANAATALGTVAMSGSASTARAVLVAALDDASSAIAARAARSLGTRREKAASSALAKVAASSRDYVALSAVLALLDLGDGRAPSLLSALLHRKTLQRDYRLETASAILERRRGGSTEALAHLGNAIADRPDFVLAREMRAELLEKLGRHEEAERDRLRAIRFRH